MTHRIEDHRQTGKIGRAMIVSREVHAGSSFMMYEEVFVPHGPVSTSLPSYPGIVGTDKTRCGSLPLFHIVTHI